MTLKEQLAAIDQKLLDNGILTWRNPLFYRGYRIYHNDIGYPYGHKYKFCHDEYDGPGDNRLGSGRTIEECVLEINNQINT